MRASVLVVLVVALATTGVRAQLCSDQGDCSDCIAQGSCGWCQGSCVEGSGSGSDNGDCTSGADNWLWTSCPTNPDDPCSGYDECSDCTDAISNDCGWCAATSECMSGDYSGPTSGTCDGQNDDVNNGWQFGSCDDCSLNSDCSSCTLAANCGWCHTTGTCLAGNSIGAASGSCEYSTWSWDNDQCCDNIYDCSDCVANSNCGWCDGDDTCYSGDYDGPNGFNVCFEDWDYDSGSCDTTWSPGGFGFVFCYIILPILCFIVCVRGCVWAAYRQRRRRTYRPLVNGNTAAAATGVTVTTGGAYAAPSGAYQQSLPAQQVPPSGAPYQAYQQQPPAYQQASGAGAGQPYYAVNAGAAPASAYQPSAQAPPNYYAQQVPPYTAGKNELPPPS